MANQLRLTLQVPAWVPLQHNFVWLMHMHADNRHSSVPVPVHVPAPVHRHIDDMLRSETYTATQQVNDL